MIKYLIDFKTEKLITIAKAAGYIQQLAGMYSKECVYEGRIFTVLQRGNLFQHEQC